MSNQSSEFKKSEAAKDEGLAHFYPSVLFSFFLTYLFHEVFMNVNWAGINDIISSSMFVYYPFFAYMVINNSYQVITHLLTTFTFAGIPIGMVPGGAKEDQTCLEFTLHNFIDVSGWLMYFIIIKDVHFIMSLLAAVHCGVGITAVLETNVFQRYYIQTAHAPLIFHWFKIMFVTLDAIMRTYALSTLIW